MQRLSGLERRSGTKGVWTWSFMGRNHAHRQAIGSYDSVQMSRGLDEAQIAGLHCL